MDTTRLANKVAIVTGGGAGIGRALTLRFAQEGAWVIATGTGGNEQKVAEEAPGGRVIPMRCNIAVPEDVERLIALCQERFGRLDILCNNAGIGLPRKRVHEVTLEEWDRVMNVNARGTFSMLRAGIPLMLASGGGSIINIGSVGSFRATAGASPYVASKAALLLLTRAAALEYVNEGIRVNTICPGTIATPMLDKHPQEFIDSLAARVPMGRLGEPEEVAALAAFLASDESGFITGQAYIIDGGRCAG